MIWDIFEVLINVFQGFLMVYFVRKRLAIRDFRLLPSVIAVSAISIFLTCHAFFEWTVPDVFVFTIPLTYSLLLSKEKWYMSIVWNAFLAIIVICTTDFVSNLHMTLFGSSWEMIMSQTSERLLCVIVANILLLVLIYFFTVNIKETIHVSFFPAISVMCSEILNLVLAETMFILQAREQINNMVLTIIGMCLLLLSFLQIMLYEFLEKMQKKINYDKDRISSLALTNQYIAEVKEMYSAFLAQQHEIKNQLKISKEMYSADFKDAGRQFLEFDIPGPKIMTGNLAVDALLTVKMDTMEKDEIRFHFDPYPISQLPVDEVAFCVMLNNLLDNAIEAVIRSQFSRGQEEADIRLSFLRARDNFFISCINRMDPSTISTEGNHFMTSKDEKNVHGFGIENIRHLVQANGGQCKFYADESIFHAEIILPFCENIDD